MQYNKKKEDPDDPVLSTFCKQSLEHSPRWGPLGHISTGCIDQ